MRCYCNELWWIGICALIYLCCCTSLTFWEFGAIWRWMLCLMSVKFLLINCVWYGFSCNMSRHSLVKLIYVVVWLIYAYIYMYLTKVGQTNALMHMSHIQMCSLFFKYHNQIKMSVYRIDTIIIREMLMTWSPEQIIFSQYSVEKCKTEICCVLHHSDLESQCFYIICII